MSTSDRLLDLGSGDGRFCIAAVQQFGAAAALGIEIDEALVRLSQQRAKLCGVSEKAIFLCADLTHCDSDAFIRSYLGTPSLVIVFLLPQAEQMFQDVLLRMYNAGARVLSLAFALDRIQGLTLIKKDNPMFLYGKSE